ncbi:LmeA family phospholipid-binding protein [Nocardia seriolae]|uniref:DUF2993 domain-containing protein n=1 Tax=Nocardia seriolae TaxID=37332 RepID=A0ABC8AN60_9NOCA|nr:DUF2993 domain-containing protein [Nocardia seriolae]APA95698.1 hypothetical protein NS506_01628 [Nocardia seriolae]OJF82838.1 hypothetical protein NS14008_31525 [Nocardia seriolae]PSK29578.1 DUF2993 domain-containing protein [Nocardia seriolae]QOW33594.1 DUF2993 domain-containing protein [Nocardia seriolae]QUN20653.1 DUF2993 domain-containing protein [Nocardia seriolae]
MRALLITVVVLAIALVVGDRVAVTVAQNEIARQIKTRYDLPNQPGVGIGGFPFLTQAVEGKYGEVDIRIGDTTQQQVSVKDVDVKLSDVTASISDLTQNHASNIVAATATATALVPYDVVQHYAPKELESISDGPDGLSATGKFSVAGVSVPATVIITVTPTDNGIEITPVSAKPRSGGPAIPLAPLRQSLTFTVPLQQLPLGAKLTTIKPTSNGLEATAVAHDVHLSDIPVTKQ